MRLPRPVTAAVATAAVATFGLSLSTPAASSSTTGPYVLAKIASVDGGGMEVMRWDPCGPAIEYKVNVRDIVGRDARLRAIHEVRTAVGEIASISGLRFSYGGRTRDIPRTGNIARQQTPLVVAFVRPAETSFPLAGAIAGYGGVYGSFRLTGAEHFQVTRGYVVIDNPQTRTMSKSLTAGGVTRPNVIRHELGHAVGLEHVSDSRQLMYPAIHPGGPSSYAWGDREGLKKVGRAAGCIL